MEDLPALILPLKMEYFEAIRKGEKLEEYRLNTPYWRKRLVGRNYSAVVLTLGYPKGGGVYGATRLVREWRGYTMARIRHPHFGPDLVNVFAIDVANAIDDVRL